MKNKKLLLILSIIFIFKLSYSENNNQAVKINSSNSSNTQILKPVSEGQIEEAKKNILTKSLEEVIEETGTANPEAADSLKENSPAVEKVETEKEDVLTPAPVSTKTETKKAENATSSNLKKKGTKSKKKMTLDEKINSNLSKLEEMLNKLEGN